MFHRFLPIASWTALTLCMAACGKPRPAVETPLPTPDPARPWKVGLIAPLSGEKEVFGRSLREGVELAVETINRSGGVDGRPFALVVADSVAASGGIVSAVKTLEEAGVLAIVGDVTSDATLEAAAAANALGVPLIVPAATRQDLTSIGPEVFRVCYADPFPARVMSTFSLSIGATRAAVFSDPSSPYSAELAAEFTKDFEARGGKIVSKQTYTKGQTDFAAALDKIKEAQTDVVFLPGYFTEAAVIISQARTRGLDVPFLGTDGWEAEALLEKGGKALDNSYITGHFAADDPAVVESPFVKDFRERHGRLPNSLAALGFDSVSLVADALARAEPKDRTALREALAATVGYRGVTGTVSYGSERTPSKPAVILRIDDGKFTYLQTIP